MRGSSKALRSSAARSKKTAKKQGRITRQRIDGNVKGTELTTDSFTIDYILSETQTGPTVSEGTGVTIEKATDNQGSNNYYKIKTDTSNQTDYEEGLKKFEVYPVIAGINKGRFYNSSINIEDGSEGGNKGDDEQKPVVGFYEKSGTSYKLLFFSTSNNRIWSNKDKDENEKALYVKESDFEFVGNGSDEVKFGWGNLEQEVDLNENADGYWELDTSEMSIGTYAGELKFGSNKGRLSENQPLGQKGKITMQTNK